MNANPRNLLILAAVLILSAVVWSAVAAQDATSTAEPTAESTPESVPDSAASIPAEGRPLLGVSLQDSDSGVTIAEVLDGSAAADAGLQVGDVITAINGSDVATVEDAKTAIAGLSVGDSVTIDFTRNGDAMSVMATLGAQVEQPVLPGNPSRGQGQGRGNRNAERELGLSYNSDDQTWTITSLSEDNPLYAAGLREGDVINSIDGEAVDPASLFQHLQALGADTTVTLTVERDGQTQDIQISASDLTALLGHGMMGGFGMGELPRAFSQMLPMFHSAYGNGWLGVSFQTIDDQIAQDNSLTVTDGALITTVAEDSPAADAGLLENDIVTAVNGESVDQEHTLRDRLIAYEADDTVTLTVLRDGQSQDIQVTLGQPQMLDMQSMFPNGFRFEGGNGGFPFPNIPDQPQPTEEAAPNA